MESSIENPVLRLKVMEALRAESPAALSELADVYNLAKTPNILGMAVQVSNPAVLTRVVELYDSWHRSINEADDKGNTPLHLAVCFKNLAAIKLLMENPFINDTLPNKDGLLAQDMTQDPQTLQLLNKLQDDFAAKTALRLRYAFKSQNHEALSEVFGNPRVPEYIDINGLDPDTGLTVLHSSAASNNEKLVELILANGGNPLTKDAKGRLAVELTKHDGIKRLLNNAAKSQAILVESIQGQDPHGPPKMSGYLSKYTNFTTGYKTRWFKLENNKLSYAKTPQEQVRGTVSLRNATVKVHSGEQRRFEVKTPSNKFHLRANNTVEANQWVWSLQNAISYARDGERTSRKSASLNRHGSKLSISSVASSGRTGAGLAALTAGTGAAAAGTAGRGGAGPGQRGAEAAPTHLHPNAQVPGQDGAHLGHTRTKSGVSTGGASRHSPSSLGAPHSQQNAFIVNDLGSTGAHDDDYDSTSEDEGDWHTMKPPPTTVDSMRVQLGAIREILLFLSPKAQDPQIHEAVESSIANIDTLSGDITKYNDHMWAQIQRLRGLLDRSENAQRIWAQQVRDLEIKAEALEGKLEQANATALGSAGTAGNEPEEEDVFYDTYDEWQFENRHGTTQTAAGGPVGGIEAARSAAHTDNVPGTYRSDVDPRTSAQDVDAVLSGVKEQHEQQGLHEQAPQYQQAPPSIKEPHHEQQQESQQNQVPPPHEQYLQDGGEPPQAPSQTKSQEQHHGQQEGDQNKHQRESDAAQGHEGHGGEAAVGAATAAGTAGAGAAAYAAHENSQAEQGTTQTGHPGQQDPEEEPPVSSNPSEYDSKNDPAAAAHSKEAPQAPQGANIGNLVKNVSTEKQRTIAEQIAKDNSFAGYDDPPRQRLKLDADNRPKISLWGILKNLIGKDMTRMTLPVSFNECTSLIQRSAEDMEYVDLLDKAAHVTDDPGLRLAYVAAFAASSYSSTTNRVAKPFNPLLGETYEYCRPDHGFRLMAEQVSHHPPISALRAESPRWEFYGNSNVDSNFNGRSFTINPLGLWYLTLRPDQGADVDEELYTFRKVTSSVVGIMVGNPVVDNYGEMNIKNHTTGLTCTLNFKARGWRGGSAYKVEGAVLDKNGQELYTIGGQWNDKIYATKAGSKGKLLLWQVHDRPPAPFNLTPFAITLNALPDRLAPWLAPTDTRFRPDQRAMEEGRYDDASDEKYRVEQKQRAARREREQSGVSYEPRWFTTEKHPVTGDECYVPIHNYWGLRAQHGLTDKGDIF